MAKIKLAGNRKPAISPTRGLIPCALLILGGIVLFGYFFYYSLKSAT